MLRKNLQDHEDNKCPNRQVKCQQCQSKGRYKYISSKQHIKGCSGYPLPCPNSCGQKDIKRKYIEVHRQVCPLELVECSFSETGCGDVPRQDLEAHLASDTKQHLALVMTTMTTTKKQLTEKNASKLQHHGFPCDQRAWCNWFTYSLEIDSIKTTLALVTTMLETGTKYCLRMTNTISSLKHHSESFLVKPGYTRCRFTTQISVNLMYQRVYTWKGEKTMINWDGRCREWLSH